MRGDLDFEELVGQYYAPLHRFALSLAGNGSDAGDLVQQTFYVWARKGHQLDDSSKVKSWLFTTLYREFLARERKVARFPHRELEEAEDELPSVPPETPARPDWALVSACLARLDQVFQGPVALFYLEDCSYNEIAAILDVPLGTVKSRIARGVGRLQQMMAEPPAAAARPRPETP